MPVLVLNAASVRALNGRQMSLSLADLSRKMSLLKGNEVAHKIAGRVREPGSQNQATEWVWGGPSPCCCCCCDSDPVASSVGPGPRVPPLALWTLSPPGTGSHRSLPKTGLLGPHFLVSSSRCKALTGCSHLREPSHMP